MECNICNTEIVKIECTTCKKTWCVTCDMSWNSVCVKNNRKKHCPYCRVPCVRSLIDILRDCKEIIISDPNEVDEEDSQDVDHPDDTTDISSQNEYVDYSDTIADSESESDSQNEYVDYPEEPTDSDSDY